MEQAQIEKVGRGEDHCPNWLSIKAMGTGWIEKVLVG